MYRIKNPHFLYFPINSTPFLINNVPVKTKITFWTGEFKNSLIYSRLVLLDIYFINFRDTLIILK